MDNLIIAHIAFAESFLKIQSNLKSNLNRRTQDVERCLRISGSSSDGDLDNLFSRIRSVTQHLEIIYQHITLEEQPTISTVPELARFVRNFTAVEIDEDTSGEDEVLLYIITAIARFSCVKKLRLIVVSELTLKVLSSWSRKLLVMHHSRPVAPPMIYRLPFGMSRTKLPPRPPPFINYIEGKDEDEEEAEDEEEDYVLVEGFDDWIKV